MPAQKHRDVVHDTTLERIRQINYYMNEVNNAFSPKPFKIMLKESFSISEHNGSELGSNVSHLLLYLVRIQICIVSHLYMLFRSYSVDMCVSRNILLTLFLQISLI